MKMVHQFQYQPLNSTEKEIRLLEIDSNQDASRPLELKLWHIKLGDSPEYWTLSYTWGAPFDGLSPEWDDPNSKHLVKINGKDFHVRWNLDAALRRLAQYGIPALWVDAICIDQSNTAEKNHQIQNMRNIYTHARATFAWLGPESHDSRMETDAISHLMNSWDERPDHLKSYDGDPQYLQEYWSLVRCDLGYENALQDLRDVAQLLGRNWFRRVWIIQEVVLSRMVVLHWGEHGLATWDWLESVVFLLRQHCRLGIVFSCPDLWKAQPLLCQSLMDVQKSASFFCRTSDLRRYFQQNITGYALLVLDAMLPFEASNPSDRIYGGLGMMRESMDITVDYNLTTAEVFKTATRKLLEVGCDFSILALWKPSTKENFPSWAVDFEGGPGFNALGSHRRLDSGIRLYEAGGKLPSRFQFEDDSTLEVWGLPIGVVNFIGDPAAVYRLLPAEGMIENGQLITPDGCLNFKSLQESWMGAWIDQLKSLGTPENLWQENYIWTKEPICHAFAHTVCANIVKALNSDNASRIQPSFDFTAEDLRFLASTTLTDILYGRTFAATSLWHFCLVPSDTVVGDVVFVATGAETPWILRPVEQGRYRFRGFAYVHGFMDGKVLELGKTAEGGFQDIPFIIV